MLSSSLPLLSPMLFVLQPSLYHSSKSLPTTDVEAIHWLPLFFHKQCFRCFYKMSMICFTPLEIEFATPTDMSVGGSLIFDLALDFPGYSSRFSPHLLTHSSADSEGGFMPKGLGYTSEKFPMWPVEGRLLEPYIIHSLCSPRIPRSKLATLVHRFILFVIYTRSMGMKSCRVHLMRAEQFQSLD